MPRESFKRVFCRGHNKDCIILTAYVYDFSVDYWDISVDKILDIHKYLMKKNII